LINWFSPINFFTRQQDIHDTQEPGTGEWFLANDSVKAWILGLGTTLWCPGIPGAGKTVLASMVVHHLRKTLNLPGTIGVAALYLNHKEAEHIQSPEDLLASIWRQLVFRRPITVKVQELYEEHHEPRTRPSMEDIHQVLCSIVAEYSKVFLIVDALDEYPDGKRKILLGKLADLGPTINLMVTARIHVDVPSVLGNPQRLEIQATAEDIRRYVNSQISKSPRLSEHVQASPELRQKIETLSIERSKGMFLLAKLHITSILTKATIKAVLKALQQMPSDLHETYKEVMQRINQQSEDDKKVAHSALAWISNAKRLLRVSELREALAVEQGTSGLDPENLLNMTIVLSVCAGLVVIDPAEDVVRLVHYTTED
ncbi:hypothetical protein B0H13DRAFT_1624345, partial [Mycena leptocephala]